MRIGFIIALAIGAALTAGSPALAKEKQATTHKTAYDCHNEARAAGVRNSTEHRAYVKRCLGKS